jgi:CRISPR-associated protein (TIGR02584 family)
MPDAATQDVVLFAPLGSNPALLVTMAWALQRQHGLRVVEAHVVVADKGALYLEEELLCEGGGLEQLHEALGAATLPADRLCVHVVKRPDGTAIGEELLDTDGDLYQRAIAEAAAKAISCARERGVVFALIAGRRRSMTVMASVIAQFLARPRDLVMDLHIDPRGADIPNQFFFPEQGDQELLQLGADSLHPRDVVVRAVPVGVPRLEAFFRGTSLSTHPDLLQVAQRRLDELAPLRLEIRLDGEDYGAFVRDPMVADPVKIPLSDAHLLYVASLIKGRKDSDDGWVAAPTVKNRGGRLAELVRGFDWTYKKEQPGGIRLLSENDDEALDELECNDLECAKADLKNLRSKAADSIQAFTESRDARYRMLVLEGTKKGGGGWQWRIPLEDAEIIS